MEAITDGGNGSGEDTFPDSNQPTLFTRRKLPGPEVKRPGNTFIAELNINNKVVLILF